MAQALTFSQIITNSYAVTKTLLKTYVLGALLLLFISIIFRGIGSGLFVVTDIPALSHNIMIVTTAAIIGFAFTIIGAIFQMLQTMYALVLATDRTQTVKGGIQKAWRYLWKLILGGLWMMVRSYVWITFLGIPFIVLGVEYNYMFLMVIGWLLFAAGAVCALYLMPLLAFTNIIQLQDGKGPRASAALSIERTDGYWGKIVGNNILMALSMMLLTGALVAVVALIGFMMVAILRALPTIVAVIIGLPVGLVLVIAAIIYFFGITLFGQVYMVEMYETIKANPRVKRA